MTETELCEKAIIWLQEQHWNIYQEVQPLRGSSIYDLVAVRERVVWTLEAKLSFGLSLVRQAHRALHHANMVSIVIPWAKPSKNRDFARLLCRHFGIGIVTIGTRHNPDEIEYESGRFFRPPQCWIDTLRKCLLPEMMTGEFGKAGNDTGARWTPYRRTMIEVRDFLTKNGPSTIKEIMAHIGHHYASDAGAKSCIPSALRKWEDWAGCRKDKRPYVYFVRELDKEQTTAES